MRNFIAVLYLCIGCTFFHSEIVENNHFSSSNRSFSEYFGVAVYCNFVMRPSYHTSDLQTALFGARTEFSLGMFSTDLPYGKQFAHLEEHRAPKGVPLQYVLQTVPVFALMLSQTNMT